MHAAKYNLHLAFLIESWCGAKRLGGPQRAASCSAKRRSAPRRTHAARSPAAVAGTSEVRFSAPIELRQGSGGAAPGKFLRDFTL